MKAFDARAVASEEEAIDQAVDLAQRHAGVQKLGKVDRCVFPLDRKAFILYPQRHKDAAFCPVVGDGTPQMTGDGPV
ncbi:hypothetical protein SAMN05216228_102431 [Rhizobium tibeticum]|uniref:Uncharacterized protein n=1 Tax=Rhizobium tibeticum TaxID=501024 RepID=A0A1H8SBP6_9HYPH|nr:hypothetical protein RTCCBAU85039_4768 [Rhizobium tibeticum]SEO76101.1 hypothetical protein SAMN05216228_102431 [Rhizobium tibeticum]